MSKYFKFDSQIIRDQETLLAALAECGYSEGKVEVHETAQTLYDYVGKARPERAHVIIRRHNTRADASNDVGFLRNANGTYTMILSDYDTRAMRSVHGADFMEKLSGVYTKLVQDKAVQTVLTKTLVSWKMKGLVPRHATAVRVPVGETVEIRVKY